MTSSLSPVNIDQSPRWLGASGFLPALLQPGSSSFVRLAAEQLPGSFGAPSGGVPLTSTGTTIVALVYSDGVVMAGDRRATMGHEIAQRDIEKVFAADDHAIIGIAGAAGPAIDIVKLFQLELLHFEKIEGSPLSLEGKANRLASMIRENLGMAFQGLVVIPLFAGWDVAHGTGRIFSYDATGGRYEEHAFHTVGSGSAFARGSLKKLYRTDLDLEGAATAAVQSLFDAADDDSATGGPDLTRGIFPVVISASASGVRRFADEEIDRITRDVVRHRIERPDGPNAGLL